MKKIYYLKTCDTCRRMLKEMDITGFTLQEIKTAPISVKQLDELHFLTNSYLGKTNNSSENIEYAVRGCFCGFSTTAALIK